MQLTLPGVGVSSHLFLRGVGPSAGLPGVGVASHRLPAPGVAPGVASQWAAGVAPGVASQLLVAGVASTVSQSATLAFLLQQQNICQQGSGVIQAMVQSCHSLLDASIAASMHVFMPQHGEPVNEQNSTSGQHIYTRACYMENVEAVTMPA